MSYNGSGTFQINTSGQPVVTGTVISSSAFNALTADLATGLSTAITKDGQTATTVRIPFAQGINSSLTTDTSSGSTGSIYTAGGVGIAKALYVGTNATVVGTLAVGGTATFSATPIFSALTASSAVATDASKNLVSVANTGTGNNVLSASPTLTGTMAGASLSLSSLTSGRVPYATTAGLLTDSANLLFDGTTLTASSITSKAATALTLQSAGTTAITVDTSQNVGIGTTSPTQKVHIQQTSSGASLTQLVLQNQDNAAGTASSIGFANHSSSGLITQKIEGYVEGSNAYSMRFYTYETTLKERMRIDSSGKLIIGASAGFGAGKVNIAYTPGVTTGLSFLPSTDASGPTPCNFLNAAGTSVGSITTTASLTAYNVTSDYRLKENIFPMTGALERIKALKPVTYTWKADGSDGEGFIAHELAEVCPYAVTGEKDAIDADGNPKHQGIDVSFLVSTLTAAIQEQQALITSLTDRIVALEAK